MNRATYITTAIPYVNARPHVGFALELVQADVIARYHRLLNNTMWFQTGTDENAFKNVLSARDQKLTTQTLVDRNSHLFQELAIALNISYDGFIRTTSIQHERAVHEFWRQLRKDDIYRHNYKGLYCTQCEDFYLERDLINGRCPEHGTEPTEVQENNYFFRLSDYAERINELLKSGNIKIIPETRRNEVVSFVSRGLQDISISRPYDRSGGWGIQVPDDPSQVVYVWIDALINYLSGLGYGTTSNWTDFWNVDTLKIHVIGKNVWKFHAVYWPALLLSAGLALPDEIIVHGFLTEAGQKISKSKGNAIDPFEVIREFGADALRYYLLRGASPFGDSDFSIERLKSLYNSDLANGLGNLINRVTTLSQKANCGRYYCSDIPSAPEDYHESLRQYNLDSSLKAIWAIVTRLNRDIDKKRPWETLREGNTSSLQIQLGEWLREIHRIAYWLGPFLPTACERILGILSNDVIETQKALFPRLV